jgi:ABC-type multidrug transport system ATPase subunit
VALDGLSLDVKGGEIFGLLGPNGAGKSTTVRMLTTLMKITSGSARRQGRRRRRSRRRSQADRREFVILQGRLFGMSRISVFGGPTGVGHHVFQDGLDQAEAEAAWGSWLERIFS